MVEKTTNVAPVNPPTATPATPAPALPAAAPAKPVPAHCQPCPPTFTLHAPLRWKSANALEQKMLENLQGNILKGHGRDHTTNLFVQFGTDALKCKRVLRELGNFHVTSAYKQLLASEAFRTGGTDGGTFCAAFISAKGYQKLGQSFAAPVDNTAFAPGMKAPASLANLGDRLSDWEPEFQQDIDAMVLIADDNTGRGDVRAAEIQGLLTAAGCTTVRRQKGKAIRNSVGNGLEHFGYVDGRSQPLMLLEDIEAESRDEGIARWDPTAPLTKALVADPLAHDSEGLSFGSFFIFRKLEQNVKMFKTREQDLADALLLTGSDDRELAGALVVGRFEDGTPVTLSDQARGSKAPRNDFDYDGDAAGRRCPFHAHIRKTNPRGSGGFEPEADEQLHIMARRGITYEDTPRVVHPDALPEADDKQEFLDQVQPFLPDGKLGLLFMAYNSKLDKQFVFTQQSWANNTAFPKVPAPPPPGFDGVIGQDVANAPGQQAYPKQWDEPASGSQPFDFKGFVHMKGGEYFFAPSLHFLRNL